MVETKQNQPITSKHLQTPIVKVRRSLQSLWAFSRPHTIIGTVLSVVALGVMAVAVSSDVAADLAAGVASTTVPMGLACFAIGAALVPSLCANVYIVGLNQLTDIAIDRINKPRLPLASGAFSIYTGRRIVLAMGSLALLLAMVQGPILFTTVALSMAIGTIYSMPPLRLKRFPFWAALCIFGVRGVIVNLGFFLHFQHRFFPNLPTGPSVSPDVWALTLFVILFAFAIAIFKDIPDLEGDRQFQVRTLTVRLGPTFVFQLSRWVLTLCYGLLIGLTLLGSLPTVNPFFLIATHFALLGLMWWRSYRVKLNRKEDIRRFYQFIWILFFCEYLLFPLACLIP